MLDSKANARLKELLLDGLTSGQDVPITPQFWADLRSEALRIHDLRGKRDINSILEEDLSETEEWQV